MALMAFTKSSDTVGTVGEGGLDLKDLAGGSKSGEHYGHDVSSTQRFWGGFVDVYRVLRGVEGIFVDLT